MRMSHKVHKLATGLLLLSTTLPAAANPNLPGPEQLLAFKPVQKDVVYSTPTGAEAAKCTVELVQNKNSTGYALKDARGLMLRKFMDNNGDRTIDQWSYYRDGIEVYRELDSSMKSGRADRFCWLNTGGSKIGVDRNGDGAIDAWITLSAEELSQEVLKAILAKDFKRLEILLVTEADLMLLGAPTSEIERIKSIQKESEKKFRQTVGKLSGLNETTTWFALETGAPSRLPADATGMKQDVLMYYQGQLICLTGDKREVIQLGEMVLIGETWKLLDAPVPGLDTAGPIASENKELQELYKRLSELDKAAPAYKGIGADPAVANYHTQRAVIIEQIIGKCPAADRSMWVRQLIDSHGTAAQAGDAKAIERLTALANQLAQAEPAGELAAYAAFRLISTEYGIQVMTVKNAEEMLRIQGEHAKKLAAFVFRFPKADDSADALMQLATIHDIQNNDKEARKWYTQLVEKHPTSPQRPRAIGALRRIDLEGQAWELAGQVQNLTAVPFDMKTLRGKPFVVYYWTSLSPSAGDDLARLGQLQRSHGIEIVAVNVDENIAAAQAFLKKNAPPGHHLHSPGGQDSPAAVHYGLMVFPHLFLVDKSGKVVNNAAEISGLDAELKKMK